MVSILLVDDCATDRARISGLLSGIVPVVNIESGGEGSVSTCGPHLVSTATNGAEALEIIRRQPVDLVLTDLLMPEMDGLQLVRHLRTERPELPVILMTGAGSEEIAVQALKDGAVSYVNKGTAARWLSENIERVLAAWAESVSQAAVLSNLHRDDYEFSLTNDRSLMSSTARFLRQAVQRVGVCSESVVPRIGIAMEEALLNACLHGNLELDSRLREGDGEEFERLVQIRTRQQPWMDRRVVVRASISQSQVCVQICDEGPGFNPGNLPDPTDPENLLKPHGRGILMMRLFLDDVQWNECGNQVTLIKNAEHP